MSVTSRLVWLAGLPLLIIVLLAGVSLWAFAKINQGVGRIYDDRVVPLTQLKQVSDAYTNTVNAVNKADNGLMLPSDAAILIRESQVNIKTGWQIYSLGNLNESESELRDEAASYFNEADVLIEEAAEILEAMGTDLQFDEDGDTLVTEYNGDLYEYIDPITDAIDALIKIQLGIAQDERTNAQSIYDSVFVVFIITGLASLVLIGVSGFLVIKSIKNPLRILRSVIDTVEREKDLTLTVNLKHHDEIGSVGNDLNKMLTAFAAVMLDVHNTSSDLRISADELKQITQKTQGDFDVQMRESEAVASASIEMSAAIDSVNDNAAQANKAARDALDAVVNGKEVVDATQKSVIRLEGKVTEATATIERVKRDSDAISSVLEVIKGISEQTNLLALNAAIEAARAGDQGRGFAVVADEVRALAVRTQESTQEIQTTINSLHEGIASAVETITEGKSEVDTTVSQTELSNQSLETIATAVDLITQMSEKIANAIQKQKTVSQEISNNITRIAEVSKDSQVQIEAAQSYSNSLLDTAERLSSWVGQFKFR